MSWGKDPFILVVIPDLIRNPGFPMKIGTQSLNWIPAFAGMTKLRKGRKKTLSW